MLRVFQVLLVALLMSHVGHSGLLAEDYYLDSPYNTGTLRFEIDNDTVWDTDSNFTNGWSLQYHSARYANWEETGAFGLIQWIGRHFPTLDDEDAVVRIGHGIGQNMMTPGDLSVEMPPEGDVPYAGSLTYSLAWQSFNRHYARNLQLTLGILGEESLAEDFQKFFHNDLGLGEDPKGWDTQRETEPILNIGYYNVWRLAHLGQYTNDWSGQLSVGVGVLLGNLETAVEAGAMLRFGWNILEGFGTIPAPPGIGFFQASYLPKPAFASPHSVEMVLGVIGVYEIYTVGYDGSLITSDDRDVAREDYFGTLVWGFNYHYHKLFSLRIFLQASSDLLKKESLPEPPPGKEQTNANTSYGALIIDIHF